ncbi:hypothetical protein Tcan_12272 [Toxocara canis]|uniref:Uncharacterized protein n=1 Tax=Toxocara canis TaxID=6265 RepID=A0A0B2VRV2_TOXCA|nr:hypothetical protein Tcan_12272 [Toxocara canis]
MVMKTKKGRGMGCCGLVSLNDHRIILTVSSKLCQGMVCMHLHEALGRLVKVGFDRVVMMWDVKQLVQ